MARRGALGWGLVVAGVVLAVVAVLLLTRPDGGLQPWSSDGADPQEYAAQLVTETNAARKDEGLPALTVSSCAAGEADQRAKALVGQQLEHASLTPVLEACPPSTVAAENLSRAAATPHDVADAWLASAGHRANLLDPALDQVGIGCLLDDGEMLCSQVFLGP
ncbi:CAP domain-containing protein [Cellulomonas sp. ICMP 17802]|uniref:CAP domain-containing protein n=1 Tax=Cellulomonas sp. ICMP 17802 TaxID=3239199 RepID=UPI00351AFFD9